MESLIGLLTAGTLMLHGGQIIDEPWRSLTVCFTPTRCLIETDGYLMKDKAGNVGLKLVPIVKNKKGDMYYGPFLQVELP